MIIQPDYFLSLQMPLDKDETLSLLDNHSVGSGKGLASKL